MVMAIYRIFIFSFILITGCISDKAAYQFYVSDNGKDLRYDLSIESGNNQYLTPGGQSLLPLTVKYVDNLGDPLEGESVLFEPQNSDQGIMLEGGVAITDSNGLATKYFKAEYITSDSIKIDVTAGKQVVTFDLMIKDQSNVAISDVGGTNFSCDVGTNLSQSLEVNLTDLSDHSDREGIIVVYQINSNDGTFADSSTSYYTATDANGLSSVDFKCGTVKGSNLVSVYVLDDPTLEVNYLITGVVPSDSSTLENSILTSSVSVLTSGQTIWINFIGRDQYTNQVEFDGSDTVSFSIDSGGGTLNGAPVLDGSGIYMQSYTAGGAGDVSISVLFNGQAVLNTASLTVN